MGLGRKGKELLQTAVEGYHWYEFPRMVAKWVFEMDWTWAKYIMEWYILLCVLAMIGAVLIMLYFIFITPIIDWVQDRRAEERAEQDPSFPL
jgi:hypothetical protein